MIRKSIFDLMAGQGEQFPEFIKGIVISSTISILCSLLIIISYIYVKSHDPQKIDRVSLRCVFASSVMNLLNSALDITTTQIYSGSTLCKTTATITMFARIMCSIFLTLVGINLVLVFVLNIPYTPQELERVYYPVAFLYGIIASIVPIIYQTQTHPNIHYAKNYRCYYYAYYHRIFDRNNMLWIWFYAFLFFSIFIAALCSLIASLKLLREQHIIRKKVENSTSVNPNTDLEIQKYIRNQTAVFRKVLIRCVLYPLVPLIASIWGFVNQMAFLDPNVAFETGYILSLLDSIFCNLQGLFVAIVFFSDPAMVKFLKAKIKDRKERLPRFKDSLRRTSKCSLLSITRLSAFTTGSYAEKTNEENWTEPYSDHHHHHTQSMPFSIHEHSDHQVPRPPNAYSPQPQYGNASAVASFNQSTFVPITGASNGYD
ncbi:hypothetical protein BD770DRAFT_411446 [Pilaira anomala]|nr:hypothetical protein BD770DRAFT_411446 [Pilaira anomala]